MSNLEKVVSRIHKLPSVPANIQRINKMIDNRHVTLDAIGQEISKDQSLSAQMLKLINSGFYGFSNTITSIPHAVILLGLSVVRNVVSSSWLSEMIEGSSKGIHNHALACARAGFLIAKNLGHDEPEDMGTIGLIHDIGKVVLAEHLKEDFAQVASSIADNKLRCLDAEREILGADHAEIAGWLLSKWNLPESTVGTISMHHSFDPENDNARKTAVLILANVIVHAEGYTCCGDNRMPELPVEVMECLEIDVSDLRLLMDEWIDQMYDVPRYGAN